MSPGAKNAALRAVILFLKQIPDTTEGMVLHPLVALLERKDPNCIADGSLDLHSVQRLEIPFYQAFDFLVH